MEYNILQYTTTCHTPEKSLTGSEGIGVIVGVEVTMGVEVIMGVEVFVGVEVIMGVEVVRMRSNEVVVDANKINMSIIILLHCVIKRIHGIM